VFINYPIFNEAKCMLVWESPNPRSNYSFTENILDLELRCAASNYSLRQAAQNAAPRLAQALILPLIRLDSSFINQGCPFYYW
jgi:hypothetical protein